MDQNPLISVVIPTYNRAAFVVAAIESVLAQTYPHVEILIVDDGSTDETSEKVRELIELNSREGATVKPIRYIHQNNQGPSRARNQGIAKAQGSWIAFLDSDDFWLPEKLELQVRTLERFEECGACYTNARLVDTSGLNTTAFEVSRRPYNDFMGVVPDETIQLAKAFGGSWIQTLVVRRDLVQQIGGFDPGMPWAEDRDFLFRLSLVTRFCYVDKPLAVIERTTIDVDPNARTREWDSFEFQNKAEQLMYEKWLRSAAYFPPELQTEIVRNLRCVHSSWANLYLKRGQFSEAREAVAKAISYEFTVNLAAKWMLTSLAPRLASKFARKRLTQAA